MVELYKGDRVILSPIRCDDVAVTKYVNWVNNPKVTHFIRGTGKVRTFEYEKEWALNKAKNCETGNCLSFNINIEPRFNNEDDTELLIGNCSLRRMNIYGSYSLAILIGEEQYWGKGYGTEAVSLLLRIAFNDLMAHRVELTLNASNERALACYERCGFRECGRLHETWYANGRWYDSLYMEILRDEWEELNRKAGDTLWDRLEN